jgi:23S rRNA (adenine2503-C2)-methyltransferase
MLWSDIKRVDDAAQNVTKFVFSNASAVTEAVLYKYPTFRERTVICISTQSGCPMGCRFCGAGDYFVRNLTAEEIVAQADHCLETAFAAEGVVPSQMGRLQIMFMSMGEPLLNLSALDPAVRELHRKYPNAALLISTSAPKVFYGAVERLSVDVPTVGLQFSVHESTDAARDALVPFKKKLTLQQIADAARAGIAPPAASRSSTTAPTTATPAPPTPTGCRSFSRRRSGTPPSRWSASATKACRPPTITSAASRSTSPPSWWR